MELTLKKKYEAKTNRVKGLAFHYHRPWILVSLHDGAIQLYDYRMGILLESYQEHEGPVRGIDFHKSQPLFVSGGDDYKIKVWNYQLKRCLYTLDGHLDYIRTVYFHPNEHPWILSASDDQTVRIWNWQSRQCLLALTGHNHYVMCAQWHPTEDLILSAALDHTIRIWDISGLVKRSRSAQTEPSTTTSSQVSADVFGNIDAVVKFVLEGHSRGVNWASFHPTAPYVVSGADDREVKLWKIQGNRAWEATTFRGHVNNVSCVIFHAKENVIISNSEDKTLRVWDMARNCPPLIFRRDNDRYWTLAAHPRLNLLAAGHDDGVMVFKLSRERPAFNVHNDNIYYVSDNYIKQYNMQMQKDQSLMQTKPSNNVSSKRVKRARYLLYNPYASSKDEELIIFYDGEDKEYELYVLDKKGHNKSAIVQRSAGRSVAFVTRNRFAVLEPTGELSLKNMENVNKRTIKFAERNINYIFAGGIGRLLLRSSDWITLFDVSSRKIINEINTPSRFSIKFVYWSSNFQYCALLSQFSLMICDQDLNDLCTIYEQSKMKSGAWDKNDVFIYSTATHLKYALPTGDHGIIQTLDEVVYIANVRDNDVYAMTRECQAKVIKIDNTEYVFKKALTERRYKDVQKIIVSGKLRGESIIAYLQKQGFPEVALRFVKDSETKFELALECGNIDNAFECAREMNTKECWNRFAKAALMQGNYRYVTEAYKQTLNFEKLMYLFVLNGNNFMLNKLLDIARQQKDQMMRFNISLLTNNIEEKISVLEETGQIGLAYLTAISNGLNEKAEQLKQKLGNKNITLPEFMNGNAIQSQLPHVQSIFGPFDNDELYDWPRREIQKGFFDQPDIPARTSEEILQEQQAKQKAAAAALESDEEDNDHMNDIDNYEKIGKNKSNQDNRLFDDWTANEINNTNKNQVRSPSSPTNIVDNTKHQPVNEVWDNASDFEVSEDEEEKKASSKDNAGNNIAHLSYFAMPTTGQSPSQKWLERSVTPVDMIAGGAFDLAQESLHRQFGIVNFQPLKKYFLHICLSSHAELPLIPNTSDISVGLRRNADSNDPNSSYLPAISLSLNHCHDYIKQAYSSTTKALFQDAIDLFRTVLHIIPC